MIEAKKILEMIESVDPEDMDTLDEIDAKFECWAKRLVFRCLVTQTDIDRVRYDIDGGPWQSCRPYTRSCDALKAIRPEGWYVDIKENKYGWVCALTHKKEKREPYCLWPVLVASPYTVFR